MQEVISLVVQKTGISEEKAQTAVTTVLGYIKDKLPAPIASQVEGVLQGGGGGLGGITKGLGGLFGGE